MKPLYGSFLQTSFEEHIRPKMRDSSKMNTFGCLPM
jgi:hypothetical protein